MLRNFPQFQRDQKIDLGGDRRRPIALEIKPKICGFRVIRRLYIHLILLVIVIIIIM